ncbi:MAG TPA: GTPase HflX [Cyclobacteriaceae bacterium]|nr:GTPase HflX [Cyclobacteriaceae bacterium]
MEHPIQETAVIVAVAGRQQTDFQVNDHLDELALLASTADINVIKRYTQKLEKPDPRTFIGKGKLEDISEFVENQKTDVVIFDDDLSPSQLRNLEQSLKCRIYDRSLLILDIFLKRAKTSQARTQVQLARYQYLLPRLTRMWTHLERQRGGTGTRGGAGEKEIETDRRAIRNQIAVLERKLDKIEKQTITRRKSRESIVRVALVGYTNAGKSTLMNLLSKSNAYTENKLFATVDSMVRRAMIRDIPFLVSDTVGFIRKLPHHLIESFKSTLDEVRESDILLHVIDISHPTHEEQMAVVNETLKELGAADKKIIEIYNKSDAMISLKQKEDPLLKKEELEDLYYNMHTGNGIYISALSRKNIDLLKTILYNEVKKKHILIYPNYLKKEIY